jgi:hypothetical protein
MIHLSLKFCETESNNSGLANGPNTADGLYLHGFTGNAAWYWIRWSRRFLAPGLASTGEEVY